MASLSRMHWLASGLLVALGIVGIGGCQLKGTEGTALSILGHHEDGGFPRLPPDHCRDRNRGMGGTMTSAPEADQPLVDTSCGLGSSTSCAFPGAHDGWQVIQPQISTEPMARGMGGEIIWGTYELETFVEHGDTSHCLTSSAVARYQVLRIGPSSGWLADEDNHFLHWPMTFDYSTAGETIDVTITCYSNAGPNRPYGPFGPFETYTATPDRLELFSPACRYHATFRRLGIPNNSAPVHPDAASALPAPPPDERRAKSVQRADRLHR